MNLNSNKADIFIPDGITLPEALSRCSAIAIGAHQDDCEIIALPAIVDSVGEAIPGFVAVVCSDGAGSSRTGKYVALDDQEIAQLRIKEQHEAARLGNYSAAIQLGYTSAGLKADKFDDLVEDLAALFDKARPARVFAHSLLDKHPTHIAVSAATVIALRRLSSEYQPRVFLGCEVWRGLDWIPDSLKTVVPVDDPDGLGLKLLKVFDSQISGGKSYDKAVIGRWQANATYLDSHSSDDCEQALYAVDLLPLLNNPSIDPITFALNFVQEFKREVNASLEPYRKRFLGSSSEPGR